MIAPAAVPDAWLPGLSATLVLDHAVPHGVAPQLLRPLIAAWLPSTQVRIDREEDARRAVVKLTGSRRWTVGLAAFRFAASLPHLTHLSLAEIHTDFTVQHLPFLTQMAALTSIDLTSSMVDATGVGFVSKVPNLSHVDLSHCKPNAAMIATLADMRRLESLVLYGCQTLDAAVFAPAVKMTQLKHLDLQACSGANAACLAIVGEMRTLETLRLNGCASVDAAGLAALAPLTTLRLLDVSHCSIDEECLQVIASMASLESLALAACRDVDRAGLLHVATMPRLTELTLSLCPNVDDDALGPLAELPQLRTLHLRDCIVTDAALAMFRGRIETLNV